MSSRWRRLFRPAAHESQLGLRELVGPLVRAHWLALVTMSVAAILGGFAEAGMLLVVARIAFALASEANSATLPFGIAGQISIEYLLVIAVLCIAIRAALQWLGIAVAARTHAEVLFTTRQRFTHLLMGASWPLQAGQREGRAQELLAEYAREASSSIQSVSGLIAATFTLVGMLVAAIAVNPVAAVGAAAAAVLVGLLLRPLRAVVRSRSARVADAHLELATGVTELTAALQEVRIFGVGDQIEARINDLSRHSSRRELQSAYVGGAIPVIYQAVSMSLIVGALALVFATGASGLGSLGAVVLIMIRSLSYAQGVQGYIQGLHQVAPYLETLRQEEERYRANAVPRGGEPIARLGDVSFEEVWFEYEPGQPILRDVSFTVSHGEIVGIVGPSGAGKSTLVQLLLRLREPTLGLVLVDGRDAREFSVNDWYERVTFVPQDARLLSGTVADNIRFFREWADFGSIERAARLAHIHDDIVSWPLGYNTSAGERGGQLSGGQRQRLCIARALVGDPDIMVLDEPTSALDVKSEALMRETMAELAPRKTVFVIAHRLSTLTICDRIMVILDGRLQGFDEPQKLEASNPFYSEALELSGMR